MTGVTDIKGIGPTKAETLAEEGYESIEDVAEAERESLANINGVGEERALEYIVGAQNLLEDEVDEFDLTPSEVSDELDGEDDSSPPTEETEEDKSVELHTVEISFDNPLEYHTFHAAIMRYHEKIYTGHQSAADAMQMILDGLDNRDSVSYELTEQEFNTLHTAVKQTRTNYQGNNLIEHMDALRDVEEQVNEQRREQLF